MLGPWGKGVALVTDDIVMKDNVSTGAISLLSVSSISIFVLIVVFRDKLLISRKTVYFWRCSFLLYFFEHETRVDVFS